MEPKIKNHVSVVTAWLLSMCFLIGGHSSAFATDDGKWGLNDNSQVTDEAKLAYWIIGGVYVVAVVLFLVFKSRSKKKEKAKSSYTAAAKSYPSSRARRAGGNKAA